MQTSHSSGYSVMLGVSIVLAALSLVTLIPNPAASKPNVLGYRSVCSWAPASTALCALAAGVVCTVRSRTVARNAARNRYRPFILPGAAAVLLAAVAVVFGILFAATQARFGRIIARTAPTEDSRAAAPAAGALAPDGTRTATVAEGEISATVEVTVKEGRIRGLRLAAGRNVEASLAGRLFDEVTAAQSTAVDAVSGATASSRVVLSAIEEALRKGP